MNASMHISSDSTQIDQQICRKADAGKTPYHLLPWEVLAETAKVMAFGVARYGRDNWKHVERERFLSAFLRH